MNFMVYKLDLKKAVKKKKKGNHWMENLDGKMWP